MTNIGSLKRLAAMYVAACRRQNNASRSRLPKAEKKSGAQAAIAEQLALINAMTALGASESQMAKLIFEANG